MRSWAPSVDPARLYEAGEVVYDLNKLATIIHGALVAPLETRMAKLAAQIEDWRLTPPAFRTLRADTGKTLADYPRRASVRTLYPEPKPS
jgi:hypothetical protein